jgi:hypothetical protein
MLSIKRFALAWRGGYERVREAFAVIGSHSRGFAVMVQRGGRRTFAINLKLLRTGYTFGTERYAIKG